VASRGGGGVLILLQRAVEGDLVLEEDAPTREGLDGEDALALDGEDGNEVSTMGGGGLTS
jgi:hypothetical protein